MVFWGSIILRRFHRSTSFYQMTPCHKVRIVPRPYRPPPPPPDLDYPFESVNRALKRPLSPSLSIYRLQISNVYSMSHRLSGVALSLYAQSLGILCIVSPCWIHQFVEFAHSSPEIHTLIKLIICTPFSYHYLNGIRKTLWIKGHFTTIKGIDRTAYVLTVSVIALALTLGVVL